MVLSLANCCRCRILPPLLKGNDELSSDARCTSIYISGLGLRLFLIVDGKVSLARFADGRGSPGGVAREDDGGAATSRAEDVAT